MIDADRCLVCGEIIPEGSQVCTACRKKYNIEPPDDLEETAQELRDIADVLKITEGTDTNIRKSMESILRIAARLERKSNGKACVVSVKVELGQPRKLAPLQLGRKGRRNSYAGTVRSGTVPPIRSKQVQRRF